MLNPIEGAIAVMNRLRYRPKLALIGFLFLMPLGLVTTFFISEIDSKVSQVESEATGLKYEQAVQSLLIATAQRQNSILLNYPVSVPSSEAELRFHTALTQLGDPNRSSQTIDSARRYQAALLAVGRLKEGRDDEPLEHDERSLGSASRHH